MILKAGIVTQVDPATARVRVRFPEADVTMEEAEPGLESYWLQVLHNWTMGTLAYSLPAIGAQVLCGMDESMEWGVVLGGLYSEADPPPAAPAKSVHLEFEDGSVIEYDPETSKLKAQVLGEVEVQATGKITAMSMDGLTFAGAGPVSLTGLDSMSVTASGTMTIEAFDGLVVNAYANATINAQAVVTVAAPIIALAAATSVTITAPTVTVTGAFTVTGATTLTGAVTASSTLQATGTITSLANVNAILGTQKAGVPYNFP